MLKPVPFPASDYVPAMVTTEYVIPRAVADSFARFLNSMPQEKKAPHSHCPLCWDDSDGPCLDCSKALGRDVNPILCVPAICGSS